MLADRDDALLEKVLEDVKPTTAEIYADLRKDLAAGSVIEVLLGGADHAHGVRRLWKALRHDTPFSAETAERHGIATDGPADRPGVQDRACRAHRQVVLCPDLARRGSRTVSTLGGSRLGGIYHVNGRRPGQVRGGADRRAGRARPIGERRDGRDRVAEWHTGALPFPAPPPPVYSMAIFTTDRKDDVKLSGALQKLLEEDPTLRIEHQPDTGETILHGQGEIHLNTTLERLARNYGLKV